MKIRFFAFTILLAACSSSPPTASKPENISVPQPVNENIAEAKTIFFSKQAEDPRLQTILDRVDQNIRAKTYVLSKIVPPGAVIKKDKAVTFLSKEQKTKDFFRKRDEITLSVKKSEKFQTYKLNIQFFDKRSRENNRTWLFSLNLDDKQLEDHITNTLIRFSFQSLAL